MKTTNANTNFRYPGVIPFTAEQSSIFFGRKQALQDLLKLISREKVSVLYSKSGFGKSSLVNAGLKPYCLEKNKFFPIVVRFGTNQADTRVSPLDRVKTSIERHRSYSDSLNLLLPDDHSLWKQVKNIQFQAPTPLLLIFDQFEELFTYSNAEIRDFLLELSELVIKKIPLRFRRALERLEVQSDFEDKMEIELDARILFVIRSDRLHLLNRISSFFPDVLKSVYELSALSREEAKEAIEQPAQLAGEYASPRFTYAPVALDQLLDFLQGDSDGQIEGILLQMLCEHFEQKLIIRQNLKGIESAIPKELRQVIETYYEEKINEIPDTEVDKVHRLVEEGLLSEQDGIRLSLHEAIILQEFDVNREILSLLVESRLLRAEPFARGGESYELAHDRLIPAVLKSRDHRRELARQRRLLDEKEERQREQHELEIQLEKDRLAKEKAQRQLRVVWSLLFSVAFALIIAVYGIYYAFQQRQLAEQRERETEKARIEIENNYRDLQRAQAVRDSLEFKILFARTKSVIEGGFSPPNDWMERLAEIAKSSEDSIGLHSQLQWIKENAPEHEE